MSYSLLPLDRDIVDLADKYKDVENEQLCKKLLAKISGDRLQYVLMYFYYGYTVNEISSMFNITNHEIQKTLFTALRDMRYSKSANVL